MTSIDPLPLAKIGLVLTAAVLACALSAAYAATPTPSTSKAPAAVASANPDAGAMALMARLRQQQPNTRIDSIKASPVPGLYEVQMGRNVAYVEPSGRFAVFGHMWDMEKGQNLTSQRQAYLDRLDPATLPVELALRSVRGDGSRIVHIFADPQCGYCRQLERALPELTNATVYTHLLPVLGEESKVLSAAIWCAADRQKAWEDWMIGNRRPSPASVACAAQFAEASVTVQRIATAAGIQATPTLIASDGRKHAGAMPLAQLEAWLAAPAVAAAAPASATAPATATPAARTGQAGAALTVATRKSPAVTVTAP